MVRAVFLVAGVAVFVYLLIQLGPAAVLAMLARIGWQAVPIALAYAAFQTLRAMALPLRSRALRRSASAMRCGSACPAKRSSSSRSPDRSWPSPRRPCS
jgi:hypothetical protein